MTTSPNSTANHLRTRLRGRRGVILLAATAMIFVLLGFVGMALDIGFMQWSRRRAQTAADAAALAGAWARHLGDAIVSEGKASSALNGFTDAQNGITVTINNPPTVGGYSADATAVEAIVSQDAPSYFMRALGWSILPIRARAVARQGYGTGCIYALDPDTSAALRFSGTPTVNLGCGAIVASDNNSATVVSGTAQVNLNNGASIASVGDYVVNGGGTVTPAGSLSGGAIFPGDPLADLPMPTYTNQLCWNGSAMVTGPCTDQSNLAGGSYQPGVYCGGIVVGSGTTANFAPGTYILAGRPGLTFQGNVNAIGVTFYLTESSAWPCTGMNGSNGFIGAATVNSQAIVALTAPTTGTYAGIAILSDRALSNAPHSDINGGAGFVLNGAVYMPNTDLSFSGTSDSNGYLLVIANTVDFTGNTTLHLNNLPTEFAANNAAFKKWIVIAE